MIINNKTLATPIIGKNGTTIFELTNPLNSKPEGFSVAYLELPPQESTSEHFHPTAEEAYYFLQGIGTMIVNGISKQIFAGDFIFIPKEQVHSLHNLANENLHVLVITSPPWNPDCEVIVNPTQSNNLNKNSR